MKELIEKLKAKYKSLNIDPPMLAIFASVLGVVIYLVVSLFSGDDKQTTDQIALPEDRAVVENYENKLQAYEAESKKNKNSLSLDFNKTIFSQDSTETQEKAKQEDITQDERFKELERSINQQEKQRQYTNAHNVYGDYSMWEDEEEQEPVRKVKGANRRSSTTTRSTSSTSNSYQKKEDNWEEQFDRASTPQSNTTNTQKTIAQRRQFGQKKTFDDLTPVEKRNILRIIKKTEYEETAEIPATIFTEGKVRNGEEVTFRTKEDAVLGLKIIPRGTLITGKVQISDRLYFDIPTIKIKNEFVKVKLSVYSNDGLRGIPYDGGESITEEAEQEGVDEILSTGGRVEKILKGVAKATRKKKQISVELGMNIPCYLINENVEF